MSAVILFLGFLAWQDPLEDKGALRATSAEERTMLLAAGCQNIEALDDLFISAEDLVPFENTDGRPRLSPPTAESPDWEFYEGVLFSGELLIDYDINVEPTEYSALSAAATESLVEKRIPLYLVPNDIWQGEGTFRVMGANFMQTCVTPSVELISYFDELNEFALQ